MINKTPFDDIWDPVELEKFYSGGDENSLKL